VPRDADLAGLVELLNTAPVDLLPPTLTTEEQYTALMAYLEPWIIGPPAAPLRVTHNPNPPVLRCEDKRCVCVCKLCVYVCRVGMGRGIGVL
jgi:hypothetical protein